VKSLLGFFEARRTYTESPVENRCGKSLCFLAFAPASSPMRQTLECDGGTHLYHSKLESRKEEPVVPTLPHPVDMATTYRQLKMASVFSGLPYP
jgi:hypothetical protein